MNLSDKVLMQKEQPERRVPVECYSRVVGYIRPVKHWNKAKKEEFQARKTYRLDKLDRLKGNG
jgi:anaerobic ribonucleoside-triphosphate reductase